MHINNCFLNMGVLLSQCEYALGLEKESVNNKVHLFWTPHPSSIACYRANKNKYYIPYSEVIFSHFIIQVQYNVYEISVKKVYNLLFSFIWIIKIIVFVHIFKMSSGLHNSLTESVSLVFVTTGLWKMRQKHQFPRNQNQTHLTAKKNNHWGNYYKTAI